MRYGLRVAGCEYLTIRINLQAASSEKPEAYAIKHRGIKDKISKTSQIVEPFSPYLLSLADFQLTLQTAMHLGFYLLVAVAKLNPAKSVVSLI